MWAVHAHDWYSVKATASAAIVAGGCCSKAFLVHESESVIHVVVSAGGRGVSAPLPQPRHLLRHVDFLAPLGLDDPDGAVRGADDEVWRVVGKIAVSLHVIELETHSTVVLRKGRHVRCALQEGCERQFEAAGVRLADGLVEYRFRRREIRTMVGAKGTRVPQTDPILNVRSTSILDRERIHGALE